MALSVKEMAAISARVNSAMEVGEFLEFFLGKQSGKAVKAQGLWRLFCPIHEDSVFRTLVINPRRNTYHCEHTACPAHTRPGDLVDLVARSRKISRSRALLTMIEYFGVDRLRLNETQVEEISDFVTRAEESGEDELPFVMPD